MQTITNQAVITNSCQVLEWDSTFFGFRIARLNDKRLTKASLAHILAWCQAKSVECLYFLADSEDPRTASLAEAANFHCVDTRAVFDMNLARNHVHTPEVDNDIRLVELSEIPALRAIASKSYTASRFYNDPGFPGHLCDRLYETWIEKSCLGYADAVFVAHSQGTPVGYITCQMQDNHKGQIGLVGVSADAQSQGFGTRLVKAATNWFAANDARAITVVTQGKNTAAQKLYERSGFVLSSIDTWYHLWPDRSPGRNGKTE